MLEPCSPGYVPRHSEWKVLPIGVKSGMSWAQIGEALGMHPQRAAQVGKGVTGGVKRKAGAQSD
jgi:hypothetical protein